MPRLLLSSNKYKDTLLIQEIKMQTRRKKYSLVDRSLGVPSPFETNREAASSLGNTPAPMVTGPAAVTVVPVPVGSSGLETPQDTTSTTGPAGVAAALMNDIDMVVRHDPGASSFILQVESRQQKSSVNSIDQDLQSAEDKIEMKLLVLDEGERSQVMHGLIDAFQQKVFLCFDHYKPELTLSCLRIVTSLSALKPRPKTRPTLETKPRPRSGKQTDPFAELDVEEALTRELPNFTIFRLRATVQQLLRRATLRQDGTLYFAGSSEISMATKSVQYFIWFFDFMDYLQELFLHFVEKIFTPLFKFFQDNNFLNAYGRTHSVSSAFSKLSQFSGSDNHGSSEGDNEDEDSLAEMKRSRAQAKASLMQLSKEYRDIKSVYDTSEIDKVAQRLSFAKEQLEFLLEEEDEVDPELYSEESGKMIEHLNMDFGTENLIRLVPDMLVKLKKITWLARRWLELDDQRTKDVNRKLDKLVTIENVLVKRLATLQDNISRGERTLEAETSELNCLMKKEGRSDLLTLESYNVDSSIEKLQKQLTKLNIERDGFAAKLSDIVKRKDLKEFHKLKFRFESNKLQRFMTERKMATLKYQKNLLTDDLNLELYLRPSVIHSSNKLQDDCERLEQQLRQQKEEMVSIKRALGPVQEDKASLTNRLSRDRQMQTAWQNSGDTTLNTLVLKPGNAVYIRSLHGGHRARDTIRVSQSRMKQIPLEHLDNNGFLRAVSPPSW